MMAQIWDEDTQGPMPNKCSACQDGACPHPTEFFNVILDRVLYGTFSCECLCDSVNLEQRMDQA